MLLAGSVLMVMYPVKLLVTHFPEWRKEMRESWSKKKLVICTDSGQTYIFCTTAVLLLHTPKVLIPYNEKFC